MRRTLLLIAGLDSRAVTSGRPCDGPGCATRNTPDRRRPCQGSLLTVVRPAARTGRRAGKKKTVPRWNWLRQLVRNQPRPRTAARALDVFLVPGRVHLCAQSPTTPARVSVRCRLLHLPDEGSSRKCRPATRGTRSASHEMTKKLNACLDVLEDCFKMEMAGRTVAAETGTHRSPRGRHCADRHDAAWSADCARRPQERPSEQSGSQPCEICPSTRPPLLIK